MIEGPFLCSHDAHPALNVLRKLTVPAVVLCERCGKPEGAHSQDNYCRTGKGGSWKPGLTTGGDPHAVEAANRYAPGVVGANATVLPGRAVGDWAVIGAGAVVTHDVPLGEVWVGNPARPL